MKDREFLFWIHARLTDVHGDDPLVDYLHKLRAVALAIPENQETAITAMCYNLKEARLIASRTAMKEYYENHKVCPRCGGPPSKSELVGFCQPPDTNKVECKCGWKGITDDLCPLSFIFSDTTWIFDKEEK